MTTFKNKNWNEVKNGECTRIEFITVDKGEELAIDYKETFEECDEMEMDFSYSTKLYRIAGMCFYGKM